MNAYDDNNLAFRPPQALPHRDAQAVSVLVAMIRLGQLPADMTGSLKSWPALEAARLAVIDEFGFGEADDEQD